MELSYLCRLCMESVESENATSIFGNGGRIGNEIYSITGVQVRFLHFIISAIKTKFSISDY